MNQFCKKSPRRLGPFPLLLLGPNCTRNLADSMRLFTEWIKCPTFFGFNFFPVIFFLAEFPHVPYFFCYRLIFPPSSCGVQRRFALTLGVGKVERDILEAVEACLFVAYLLASPDCILCVDSVKSVESSRNCHITFRNYISPEQRQTPS